MLRNEIRNERPGRVKRNGLAQILPEDHIDWQPVLCFDNKIPKLAHHSIMIRLRENIKEV